MFNKYKDIARLLAEINESSQKKIIKCYDIKKCLYLPAQRGSVTYEVTAKERTSD